jgi:general secretion pathway protein F
MPPALLPPLPFAVRAGLFRQLGALEDAGVPVDRALGMVRLPTVAQKRLVGMRSWLRRGEGLAEAGLRSGVFTRLEAALVNAACSAGSPARSYRRLRARYDGKAARLARIRSRLALPALMLLVSDFTAPLPRLFAGSLGAGGYLAHCLLPLLALALAAWLLRELPRRLQADSPALRPVPVDRVLTRLPVFGAMLVRRNVRDFCDSLALLLEAGMPILQALPVAVEGMRNASVRQRFAAVGARIESGTTLAQALAGISFPGAAQAHAFISTGEAGGALPEMLFRYADSETADIDRFDDSVAEWLPRLLYAFCALWVGYGILHSGAFMPQLPEDAR